MTLAILSIWVPEFVAWASSGWQCHNGIRHFLLLHTFPHKRHPSSRQRLRAFPLCLWASLELYAPHDHSLQPSEGSTRRSLAVLLVTLLVVLLVALVVVLLVALLTVLLAYADDSSQSCWTDDRSLLWSVAVGRVKADFRNESNGAHCMLHKLLLLIHLSGSF